MEVNLHHAHRFKLLIAEWAGELLLFQVLKDGEVVGDFLMDAFLVRLKMALQCEDVIATVTVEQAKFTIMLLLAVISIVIKQHKTKTTPFPVIHIIENHNRARQGYLLQ